METRKKRQWWAYAALFCLCGISLAAQRIGGGPMIPPVTIYGIWYLYILPVLGAVVLTIAAKNAESMISCCSLLLNFSFSRGLLFPRDLTTYRSSCLHCCSTA